VKSMDRIVPYMVTVLALLLCGCSPQSPASLANAVRPEELAGKDWIGLGQPGEEHRELERFIGEWKVRISSRGSPTQEPMVSEGQSRISWVLGDRFVEEHFSGVIAGERYTGRGFFGYENATRRYVNVWLESLATGVTLAYGVYGPKEGAFQFEGSVYDPLIGGLKAVVTRITFTSKDAFTMAMIEQTPTGQDFVSFELVYQRD
jgi:hypothetical protein